MIVYFRKLHYETTTLGVTHNGSIEKTWNYHLTLCNHRRRLGRIDVYVNHPTAGRP